MSLQAYKCMAVTRLHKMPDCSSVIPRKAICFLCFLGCDMTSVKTDAKNWNLYQIVQLFHPALLFRFAVLFYGNSLSHSCYPRCFKLKKQGIKTRTCALSKYSMTFPHPPPPNLPALGTATMKSHQAQDVQVYNSDSKQ